MNGTGVVSVCVERCWAHRLDRRMKKNMMMENAMMQKTAVATTAPTMTGVCDPDPLASTLEMGEDGEMELGAGSVDRVEAGELVGEVFGVVRVRRVEMVDVTFGVTKSLFQGNPPKATTETAAGQLLSSVEGDSNPSSDSLTFHPESVTMLSLDPSVNVIAPAATRPAYCG